MARPPRHATARFAPAHASPSAGSLAADRPRPVRGGTCCDERRRSSLAVPKPRSWNLLENVARTSRSRKGPTSETHIGRLRFSLPKTPAFHKAACHHGTAGVPADGNCDGALGGGGIRRDVGV